MPILSQMSAPLNGLKRKAAPNPWRQRISEFLDSKWALPTSALIGFLENTIILFAMEPLFLPAMAARGREAWKIAAALLFGNVLAGIAMYFLGMWANDAILQPIFSYFDANASYDNMVASMAEDGFWPLFLVGVTPIPFQFGAAAAGAAGYSFLFFLLAVTISRSIRYFAEAGLIMVLGKRGEEWIERHELEIFILGIGIFVGMAVMFFLL